MTVAQLKSILADLPDDLEVVHKTEDGGAPAPFSTSLQTGWALILMTEN